MTPRTVICPAGIGDWSWAWSKLYAVRDEIADFAIVDGLPRRTAPYVELCGKSARYTNEVSYSMIVANMAMHGWTTWAEAREVPGKALLLAPNAHLEAGRPLAEFLPDLPTEYHYPIYTNLADRVRARWMIDEHAALAPKEPVLAFSCASYRGSEEWKTWGAEQWIDCLRRVRAAGWQLLAVGGYWDDLTFRVACELDIPSLVGKTSVAEMVEVLRHVEGYVGYSSGMNVIRTVLDRPVMALWPDFQNDLKYSWAPPKMIEEERYVASLWRPVNDIWPLLARFLRTAERESRANGAAVVAQDANEASDAAD